MLTFILIPYSTYNMIYSIIQFKAYNIRLEVGLAAKKELTTLGEVRIFIVRC